MKRIFFLLIGALIFVGCRESVEEKNIILTTIFDDTVDLDDPETLEALVKDTPRQQELERREVDGKKLIFKMKSDQLYTGWTKRVHENGKLAFLIYCKSGLEDGPYRSWSKGGASR